MKRIYLVGYNGNMANRYKACLNYLDIDHCGVDLGDVETGAIPDCDGIIIATPTDTHINMIKRYAPFNLPILVEKPIALDPFLLNGGNVHMVNQYAHCGPFPGGETYYDCWRTGNDGLAWDCINIIGLSEKMPKLNNQSPVWKCMINGKELSLHDIDMSYVKMIDAWTRNPQSNTDYILKAHKKVREYLEANSHRHTS